MRYVDEKERLSDCDETDSKKDEEDCREVRRENSPFGWAPNDQYRLPVRLETLEAVMKKMGQSVAVVTAQGERCAVIEHDLTITVKHRLEFSYSVHLHDGGAMNSHKLPWIQPGLEVTNPLPDDMFAPLDMDSHIVTPGFDPVDVFSFHDRK